VYDYFKIKQTIEFRVETESTDRYIEAIVESIEMNHFATVVNAVIGLYCSDPYFMGMNELYHWALYQDASRNITYDGDVPIGGSFLIYYPAPSDDSMSLTNANEETTDTLDLDFTPIGGTASIDPGDKILVNTRQGQKSIVHYDQTWSSQNDLLQCLDLTSDWIKFRQGVNTIGIVGGTLGTPDADRPDPTKILACLPLNERTDVVPLEFYDDKVFTRVGTGGIPASYNTPLGNKMYEWSRNFVKENATYFSGPTVDSDLNPTADFSINLWIKADTADIGFGDRIILSAYDDANNGFKLIHNDTNKVEAIVKVGGTEYSAEATTGLTTNTWYMVTMQHISSPGSVVLTLNAGTPVTTLLVPTAITSYASKLLVGGNGGTYNYFDGPMQLVTLYDLVLSSAERTWLYRSGHGRVYAEISGEFEVETIHRPNYQGV
jgi:hypothetical protein